MKKAIVYFFLIIFLGLNLYSCVTPQQSQTSKDKQIRIALLKYEMARNIILHKDYKNLANAFSYLEDAKKVLKNDPKVYYLLGIAYQMRGNMNKYEEYLKKTIQVNKNFLDAYNGLGIYYYQKKDYNKALEMFTKLVQNPLYPNADVAFFNRSRVYLAIKQYKKAEDDLRSALIFSGYSNYIYFRDLILLEIYQKEYLKALDNLFEMEKHFSDNCFILTNKAFCYIKLDEYTQAVDTLNKIKPSSKCYKQKLKLLEEIKNDNNTNN